MTNRASAEARTTSRTPSRQATLLTDLPQPSTAYKRRVWLAVAGLLLFIALYFVLAGWFVYTAYRMTLGAESIAIEGWFLGFCSLFLAVMMLKPLFFVKHGGTEGSLEITADEQPRLFEFLHALADAAEAPRPHRVFLAANVNAAVFYDLSALNLIFPSKKNLEIGLGLVNALTLGELRAVLAHEFGHFTQSSMAVIRWSYLAQQIAANLVARRDKLDDFLVRLSHLDIRIAWIGWLLSLIVWSIRSLVDSAFGVVVLLQRALSREMEFQADLVSVSLTGSDALIHALHRLQAADDSWDRTLGLVAEQHSRDRIPRDVFTLHTRVMQRMGEILSDPTYGSVPPVPAERAAAHRLFKPELAQPPKMWLTHPLNHDREANAKRRYVKATIDDRSAWTLFDEPTAVREQVTALMIGPDAKEPVPIEDSIEALDEQFSREYFNSRYRGVYLGRSIVRGAARPSMLVDPMMSGWRQQLDQLYPDALVKDVARLRAFEKELGQLRAIHAGVLAPAEGGILHRGRVIKSHELPGAIERVERDAAAVENRLAAGDRVRRSVHLAAAKELGEGWAPYLEGLLATLHYADHTAANIDDLHGVLAHTVRVRTVTRRISSAGRKRVVAAANDLHLALSNVFAEAGEVTLDSSLAQRMGNTSWKDLLGTFQLGTADEENIGDWLGVIDGWVRQASGACGALSTEAVDQLLVSESALASHARAGTAPEAAPAPSRVPAQYETLLVGKERERTDTLNWWERFQIADGKVAGAARVVVAAGIVAAVLGLGGTVGSSTITIYNGLGVSVVVDLAGNEIAVDPHTAYTKQFSRAGAYPIVARTREGKLIERFEGQIAGRFGAFVYNVGGATPLVEWTAVYGTAKPQPERMLGAPRWVRTEAQVLFEDPPESVRTEGGWAIRHVISAASEAEPRQQLSMLADNVEQQRAISTHARWDGTSSENVMSWLAIAREDAPAFRRILTQRLAENPTDVMLLRLEQDAATGAVRDSVCARHRAMLEADPEKPNLFYLAARCVDDPAAQTQSFLDGYAYWPDNGWLSYSAGYSLAEAGRWKEAIIALEASRKKLPPFAKRTAVDLARIHRLTGDTAHALARLTKAVPELEYLTALETGEGMGDSTAYTALMHGHLDEAVKLAHSDADMEANILRLAAASDGASAEIQSRARALGPDVGVDDDTRWATIALALRDGQDPTPFLPAEGSTRREHLEGIMGFVERARAGPDIAAAEAQLHGLSPVMRGHAYSMATVILGPGTPSQWRKSARRLLFAIERPYFK
jgi:Zn-dependent protease with chaperone function/tetratricopeptide (TPR) repeat protein